MKLIETASIVDKTTLVALNFNKSSKEFLAFAQDGKLEVVHKRQGDKSSLSFYSSHPEAFSVSISELDLEEVRGRTQNMVRANRKDNEKIIIELSGEAHELQQDHLFINQLGPDSFVLWAEAIFEITNKIYSFPSYKRSDIELEHSLNSDINALLNGERPKIYNRQRAMECRMLLLRLDEIIEGESTRQLRNKAIEAKERIQNELERVRLLKSKSNLAKVFSDKVYEEKHKLMEKLIAKELGESALSLIQRTAVENVTQSMHIDEKVVGSLIDVKTEQNDERERVLKTLKNNPHFEELESFISNTNGSPNLSVESCSQCGKKPRITPTTTANGRTKRFVAKCECGNTSEDGKIGTEAVVNWNLSNNRNIALSSITLIDFVGLDDQQAFDKIGCIDQFCHRRRRLISIDQQLAPNDKKKSFNRLKGMVSVLAAVSKYAKEILQQKEALVTD